MKNPRSPEIAGIFHAKGRESFVHAERGDVQTAEGIDRDAVFARLDVPEDDQVGADAETARREGLSLQRIALPKVPTEAYSATRFFFLTLNRKTLMTDIGSMPLSGTRTMKAMPSSFRKRLRACVPFSVISSIWSLPMPNSFCPVDER